ncbi:MAG: hypothetical protein RLZZ168_24 [Cyanobacteriota bacterium]
MSKPTAFQGGKECQPNHSNAARSAAFGFSVVPPVVPPAMRTPLLALAAALVLVGCQRGPSEAQRLERLELRLQQLEQRLNAPDAPGSRDQGDKAPAGPVKSLTFRMGSADDRLRIYWADGSSSDLPCTKEQGTWACG